MTGDDAPGWLFCCLDPRNNPGRQIIRPEFGEKIIRPDLLDHRLVKHPGQRRVQGNMHLLHARVITYGSCKGIAIHLRHFNVGDHHQELFFRLFTFCDHFEQVIQRLTTVIQCDHFHPDGFQATADLLTGHRRVIDGQNAQRNRLVMNLGVDNTYRNLFGNGRYFGEDFLDIDDFHQLVIDPGYCGQVVIAPGALGWWMNLFPVHVDDAFDRMHQKPLNLGVVLGNDDEGIDQRNHPCGARRHCQIHDRNGTATNIGHATNDLARFGHDGEFRALQYFFYLEDVDPVELLAVETEQEQLQAILTHQLSSLVYRIHYTCHAEPPYQNDRHPGTRPTSGTGFAICYVMNAKMTISRHLALETCWLLCAIALLCLSGTVSLARAENFTLPEQLIGVTQGFLEFTVEDYLATNQIDGRHDIQVKQLDPRLRMGACDKDLTATLESPRPVGRVTVRVRCEGSSPWTVFVPAQVQLFRNVVTVMRPLKRDAIVTEEDIAMRERDVSSLGQGFLASLDQAVGQKVVRQMVIDQVITPVALEQPQMIHKGDQVVIIARSGSLAVRMPGEAMSDGGFNEQIRVKNLNSQRVIKANVTGPGQVEVAM
ncbi:putative Flagellar protein [Pseudomonas syringae pv. apii]|nr:putative Flagellar protein [Pseudomonas syringae pv. apii]